MKGYLLDTHTLLWAMGSPKRLGKRASKIIRENSGNVNISVVSLWEITLKISLKKLTLDTSTEYFFEQALKDLQLGVLPIQLTHLYQVEKLPFFHRDPFDRLLIAQAIAERLTIVGYDELFNNYPIKQVWD